MKKTLAITLAIILLASSAVNAAGPFTDVKETDWFCYYAEKAKDEGILAGYPDGSFRPQKDVSYGEFLAMALKGRGAESSGKHWAYGYLAKALESGLLEEGEANSAMLDLPIPRKDMALIMGRSLAISGFGGVNVSSGDKLYSDIGPLDSFEYQAALCSHYGVLNGYPDGSFRPYGYLKRSEAAAAMVALTEVLKGASEQPEASELKPGEPANREEMLELELSFVDRKAEEKTAEKLMDPELWQFIEGVLDGSRVEFESGKITAELNWPAANLSWGEDSRSDMVKIELRAYSEDNSAVAKSSLSSYRALELRSRGSGKLELKAGDAGVKPGSGKIMLYVSTRKGKETAYGYKSLDLSSGQACKGYVVKGKIAGSQTNAGYDIEALDIPCSSDIFTVKQVGLND